MLPSGHFIVLLFMRLDTSKLLRLLLNYKIKFLWNFVRYSGRGKRGRFGALEIFNSHVLTERGPPNFRTNRKYQYRRAKIIDQTIKNFINSADPAITAQHIPKEDQYGDLVVDERQEPILSPAMPSLVPEVSTVNNRIYKFQNFSCNFDRK